MISKYKVYKLLCVKYSLPCFNFFLSNLVVSLSLNIRYVYYDNEKFQPSLISWLYIWVVTLCKLTNKMLISQWKNLSIVGKRRFLNARKRPTMLGANVRQMFFICQFKQRYNPKIKSSVTSWKIKITNNVCIQNRNTRSSSHKRLKIHDHLWPRYLMIPR